MTGPQMTNPQRLDDDQLDALERKATELGLMGHEQRALIAECRARGNERDQARAELARRGVQQHAGVWSCGTCGTALRGPHA